MKENTQTYENLHASVPTRTDGPAETPFTWDSTLALPEDDYFSWVPPITEAPRRNP